MNQAVVNRLLVEHFGTSNESPTPTELTIYEQIKKELIDEDIVVEEVNALFVYEDNCDQEDFQQIEDNFPSEEKNDTSNFVEKKFRQF